MAGPRRFELDELSVRPGTYFNPQTEVLIVVDDSPEVEQAIFDETAEDGEWVLVSDETPVDETARDELLERFQARHRGGAPAAAFDEDEDEEDEGPEELDADAHELDEDGDELD